MVRNYKKPLGTRPYSNFSPESLEKALTKIAENQLSIREASRQYNISFGTLYNRFHGKHSRNYGGQTALSCQEEKVIIESVVKCGDWGFPLNIQDVRFFIKNYLDSRGKTVTKFKNNLPGKDMVYSLLKRHKSAAAQRLSANIKRARACLSVEILGQYFDNLEETIRDIPPSHIFNYDESNLCDDPGRLKGIYRRGVKYPERIVNFSKSATSIMVCGSASGVLLPPYIIYKSDCIWDKWCQNGPKGSPCCEAPCCSRGTRYARTKHGWLDAQTFEDWFMLTFLPHAKRLNGQKILIGDNLAAHINTTVLKSCEDNQIAFICLPPNATHLCQPLDVAFFRPMKMAWRKKLLEWKEVHPRSGPIPKESFPRVLKETLIEMNGTTGRIEKNLKNGFRATGIVPFDKNEVLKKLPSTTEANSNVEEAVSDTLVRYLESKRVVQPPTSRSKRTKIRVEPGKSITAPSSSESEISDEDENEDDVDNPSAQTGSCGSSDKAREAPSTSQDIQTTSPGSFDYKSLKVDDYVLTQVIGRRGKQVYKYVCHVTEIENENNIKVLGMKSCYTKTKYRCIEDDVFFIDANDIIQILPCPILVKENSKTTYVFDKPINVKEA